MLKNGELRVCGESLVSRDQWLLFCKESPYSTFFHTPMWAELFAGPAMIPVASILELSDGSSVLFPRVVKKGPMNLFSVIISMPACTFGGWISRTTLNESHHRVLLDYCGKYRDLLIRENPYDQVLNRVEIEGSEDDFTQSVDLSCGYDAVFAGSEYCHRKAVRNATKKGVTVEQAEEPAHWDEYFRIYLHSVERWKSGQIFSGVSYDSGLLRKIRNLDHAYRKLWLARVGGKAVAGIICFYWNDHAVAWHGAGLDDYFIYRPNNMLYNSAIRHACENGFRWFDCNPSSGISGVIKFKESLGASRLRCRVINRKSGLRSLISFLRRK